MLIVLQQGLVPRALELLFALAPEGSRVTLCLVGLDDTSAVDYLSAEEEAAIQNPQFKVCVPFLSFSLLFADRAHASSRTDWMAARRWCAARQCLQPTRPRPGTRCWPGSAAPRPTGTPCLPSTCLCPMATTTRPSSERCRFLNLPFCFCFFADGFVCRLPRWACRAPTSGCRAT